MKKIFISFIILLSFSLVSCNHPTVKGNGLTVNLENAEKVVKTITEDTEIIVKGNLTSDDLKIIAEFFRHKPLASFDPTVSHIPAFIPDNVKIILNLSKAKGIYELHDEFRFSDSLKKVILPKDIKIIGDNAFSECFSLTEVIIPSSVTEIGESAFSSCNISDIEISKNVTKIAMGALSGSKHISVSENNIYYSSYDGVLYNKDKSVLITCPTFHSESVSIYDDTRTISYFAFTKCDHITDIKIPESVTEICPSAFFMCNSLKSVSIPKNIPLTYKNLESIFYDCPKLRTIYYDDEPYTWNH